MTATVGNLSPSLRVKGSEVLVLGIIPGPRKRDITPFIKVVVDRGMKSLYEPSIGIDNTIIGLESIAKPTVDI